MSATRTDALKKTPEKPADQKPPDQKKETAVTATEPTMSQRFTAMVLKEFSGKIGKTMATDSMRRLIQGYFIGIDQSLRKAEDERIRKNKNNTDHKWDNLVEVSWKNVNMAELALDIMHNARVGLDMSLPNHLSAIPYKNKKTGKYVVDLQPGYNGIKYEAEKYGKDIPLMVTTELVYATDTFTPLKKNHERKFDGYEFTINTPFQRGEIVGGFGYIEYADPAKNKLIIMTKAQMDKRKPVYAAAEFWGGTKTKWVNGKETEVVVEGWLDEMYGKTLKREVYGSKNMPLDPEKIDEHLQYLHEREAKHREALAEADVQANANKDAIDIKPSHESSEPVKEDPPTAAAEQEQPPAPTGEAPEEEIELGDPGPGAPAAGNGADY